MSLIWTHTGFILGIAVAVLVIGAIGIVRSFLTR